MNRIMRTSLVVTASLVALAVPAACAPGTSKPVELPPARTVVTTSLKTLVWGEVSGIQGGVSIQVMKPMVVPVTAQRATELTRMGTREIACEVLVHNGTAGPVRIGIAGHAGKTELVPVLNAEPSIEPQSTQKVRRVLLAPDTSPVVTVYLSATVDGQAVTPGWRYEGGVSP